MQYRKLTPNGEYISTLGFGCMRFKQNGSKIDEDLALKQLFHAYEKGVNYFDTAYIYHNGKSEGLLGRFIKKYGIRDKVYIADKLPTFLIRKVENIESFFDTQLKRLDADYIDYYLMHMLDSYHSWERLKSYGILEFIKAKKANKSIRYIGFSFHGRPEEFIKILEDYDWDFCQIQYNYLDEYNQAGLAGLKRAHELNIGVVIMEPLRGGRLADNAPDKAKEILKNFPQQHSPAYWALRWIFNHKEVSVVLSGMNEIAQIDENIKVATQTLPNTMTSNEIAVIDEIKNVYKDLTKVPCTGCNYCMPCPYNVDIPSTFSAYNDKFYFTKSSGIGSYQYLSRAAGFLGGKKSGPNLCTNCGKCMRHCPQNIQIPTELKKAHKELDNVIFRKALEIAAIIFRRNKK